MNPETSERLQQKIRDLGNLPAMPSILQALSECLSGSPSDVNIDRVVSLISYDKSLAAQCLRMANSALFRRRVEVESVRGAVLALGMWRVRDIVYSCTLPGMFSHNGHGMHPATFWRHALGTAFVSQHFAQRLAMLNPEKLYLAGLLHDIGILVNALLYKEEFQRALELAQDTETPLEEVEQEVLGFSHCDSGRVLAEIWRLPADVTGAIEHHHHPSNQGADAEVTAVIYLADLLCRMRGLGYGYYEAREFHLASEAAWQFLQEGYPEAAELDLARFTFELDSYAEEVQRMVDAIFATGGADASGTREVANREN
jgi:putative nucleotidyltransferase with HDIG domain